MAWIDKGRPSKISPESRALVLDAISKNLPYDVAAWFAKIHERTLYRWLEQGQKDFEDGLITEYSDLRQAIKELEAQKIAKHLDSAEEQTERWQSRAWVLERRWRKYFSQNGEEVEKLGKQLDDIQKQLSDFKNGVKSNESKES